MPLDKGLDGDFPLPEQRRDRRPFWERNRRDAKVYGKDFHASTRRQEALKEKTPARGRTCLPERRDFKVESRSGDVPGAAYFFA